MWRVTWLAANGLQEQWFGFASGYPHGFSPSFRRRLGSNLPVSLLPYGVVVR